MKDLILEAKKAREGAYAPYSKFLVGAAVKTFSGKIYKGFNIENASFGATCCAEQAAIFSAITHGERDFQAIAVIADTDGPIAPCGVCRQVMSEFFTQKTRVLLTNLKGDTLETTIQELLPGAFVGRHLE